VILNLMRELGLNLAGVEIILNTREEMEAMQKQIQGFLETLNEELSVALLVRTSGSRNSGHNHICQDYVSLF
jgi:hypothetical protein